jgi:hypothetical protein
LLSNCVIVTLSLVYYHVGQRAGATFVDVCLVILLISPLLFLCGRWFLRRFRSFSDQQLLPKGIRKVHPVDSSASSQGESNDGGASLHGESNDGGAKLQGESSGRGRSDVAYQDRIDRAKKGNAATRLTGSGGDSASKHCFADISKVSAASDVDGVEMNRTRMRSTKV